MHALPEVVTVGEFKPNSAWRGPGAPRIAVPQAIKDKLEETYQNGSFWEDEAVQNSPEAEKFIALCKAHARQRGLRVSFQWSRGEAGETLRVKMRPKRPYRRSILPREKV